MRALLLIAVFFVATKGDPDPEPEDTVPRDCISAFWINRSVGNKTEDAKCVRGRFDWNYPSLTAVFVFNRTILPQEKQHQCMRACIRGDMQGISAMDTTYKRFPRPLQLATNVTGDSSTEPWNCTSFYKRWVQEVSITLQGPDVMERYVSLIYYAIDTKARCQNHGNRGRPEQGGRRGNRRRPGSGHRGNRRNRNRHPGSDQNSPDDIEDDTSTPNRRRPHRRRPGRRNRGPTRE